ncbi:MAG: hypothetical protein EBT92_14375 [Planctomycetes bacterium]|nr:hypothetical protein [Planctomycetota bacterium]
MTQNQPDNQNDPSFDPHEQAGHDAALTQASLILLGFVLTAIIIVTVLVDNSQAPWQVKATCVGVALMGFISLAGWLD